jgi:hypothetical protein
MNLALSMFNNPVEAQQKRVGKVDTTLNEIPHGKWLASLNSVGTDS